MRLLWWRRRRHQHQWVRGRYAGAGWSMVRCATCPAWDITA